MRDSSIFARTLLYSFLFACVFVAQSALAASSDVELYYINAYDDDSGDDGDEDAYTSELRALNVDDFSDERVVGNIDLDDDQIALSATVDSETGEVYFARLTFTDGPPHSDLVILDMETLDVKKIGELSNVSNEELLYSIAFDDKGQLYGLGMSGKAIEFYKIDKKTGEKTLLASYGDVKPDAIMPFTFNNDDGLFYFILNDVGIGAIDPSDPEDLQEVSSLESTEMIIFSFVHNTGTFFYTPMMTEIEGNMLVDFDVADMDNSELLEELDGEGMPTSIFLWSADLLKGEEDEDEDEENDDYKDCKKEYGNSAYKKAYQRVKYYKKHDNNLYLAMQSVYDLYRTSGDNVRDILRETDIETYDKYKEYRRYRKYKECKELK